MSQQTEEYRGPLAEPLPEADPVAARRSWRGERVGWGVVAALTLVSLAGVLGHGPVSWERATSTDGGLALDYQRMGRHNADDSVRLELGAGTIQDGRIEVEVRGSWIQSVRLDGLVPEPSAQRTLTDGVLLEFEAEDTGPTVVTIYFRAYEYGPLDGEVAVGDDRLTFTQWVLP